MTDPVVVLDPWQTIIEVGWGGAIGVLSNDYVAGVNNYTLKAQTPSATYTIIDYPFSDSNGPVPSPNGGPTFPGGPQWLDPPPFYHVGHTRFNGDVVSNMGTMVLDPGGERLYMGGNFAFHGVLDPNNIYSRTLNPVTGLLEYALMFEADAPAPQNVPPPAPPGPYLGYPSYQEWYDAEKAVYGVDADHQWIEATNPYDHLIYGLGQAMQFGPRETTHIRRECWLIDFSKVQEVTVQQPTVGVSANTRANRFRVRVWPKGTALALQAVPGDFRDILPVDLTIQPKADFNTTADMRKTLKVVAFNTTKFL